MTESVLFPFDIPPFEYAIGLKSSTLSVVMIGIEPELCKLNFMSRNVRIFKLSSYVNCQIVVKLESAHLRLVFFFIFDT